MKLVYLFIGHWYLSLFCQSFFLHRYCSHRLFKLNQFWEKFFYLLTYLVQGASFLNPRSYAIMHQQHHTHSDTTRDPHSPDNSKNVLEMMVKTYHHYQNILESDQDYQGPKWPLIDRLGASRFNVYLWLIFFFALYGSMNVPWYCYGMIALHMYVGPIQGAIVNWCGHRYGHRNFDTPDHSRNTLWIDVLLMGELYQNNHHQFGKKLNFAYRWFEIDLTYQLVKILRSVRVLRSN